LTLEESILALKPRRELWNDPRFQAWVKSVNLETEALQKLGLVITKASAERNQGYALKLEELGLEPPESAADSMQIYVALRCVLNFWSGNLSRLKADSLRADELEKQLANARANDNLGR
jgi:hypothetical protein